jgi:hypothetical protein
VESSKRITSCIGTYTRCESFVDGKAESIYGYHLDMSSCELTYVATVAGTGTDNPSWVWDIAWLWTGIHLQASLASIFKSTLQ